jgi:hypothetical protein
MLLLIVLILLLFACPQTWSLLTSEYDALYDLYSQTGGLQWDWKPIQSTGKIWDFTTTTSTDANVICGSLDKPISNSNWQGIKCICQPQKDCFVAELILPSYGLKGVLPASLKGLTNLIILDLSDNVLSTH